MPELHHEDARLGRCIATFDGRVLELFVKGRGSVSRLIVGMLHVEVDGPDRKGGYVAKFGTHDGMAPAGFNLHATEEQWPAVYPFVQEIWTAAQAESA